MTQWAWHKLVSDPGQADVVFEIGFTLGGSMPPALGHLRLAIRDPRNNVLRWGFAEYVQSAVPKSNRDKEFDKAMGALVDDAKTPVTQVRRQALRLTILSKMANMALGK